eukprot:COSAG01_NODE_37316_length_505_cov_0.766010_1_plen_51_part_00
MLNDDAEQVGQQLVSLPYLQLKQLHSFLAGDHVVAATSGIGGEGSFVAGI